MNSIKDALGNAGVLKTKMVAKAKTKPAPNDVRIPTIRSIKETAAVAEKRQYIGDIPVHMAGLVARIRGIQSASPEEQAIRFKEFKDLEDEVLVHLNSDDELLKSAARQAYAIAMVETLPADKRLVVETIKGNENSCLPGLLGLKILEQVPEAEAQANGGAVTVKVYGKVYRINGGGQEFTTKLAENLSAGAAHAAKAAHEFYHGEVVALKAQATISIAEMQDRKSGRFFFEASDVRDGDRFLSGGALLAESNSRAIKVLQARGHFQRVMTEIAEAGTFVPIESLSSERLEFGKRLSEDAFRRARILHAVLRRGIAEAQKAK